VLIVKRLPRYDRGPKDVKKIRSDLSAFANSVVWLRRGSNSTIKFVELNLGCSES
jgi:hypothetical protein